MNYPMTAVVLAALIGGCGSTGSRDCTPFDTPVADEWTTVPAIGETATFRTEAGQTLSLTQISREDPQPDHAASRFGIERTVCVKRSERRYLRDDGLGAITILFEQLEGYETPIEEQALDISVILEEPSGNSLTIPFFPFSVAVPETEYETPVVRSDPPRTTRLIRDTTIGDERNELAVEITYTDDQYLFDNAPAGTVPLRAMVFARGAGLVRLEYADGERYERVGPSRP